MKSQGIGRLSAALLLLVLGGPVRAQTAFVDVTATAGLTGTIHRAGTAWGDFDGDGLSDVLVGSHFYEAPTLFRNLGDGRFTDVTSTVMEPPTNLATCVVPGEPVGPWGDQHGRAWADFDNDGDLDLVQLIGAMKGLGCGPNQLYVSAAGRLADHAIEWGVDYQYSRARNPTWIDYDNDGRLDLYQGAEPRKDKQAPPTLFRGTPEGFIDVRGDTGFEPLSNHDAFAADVMGGPAMELLIDGALAVPLPLAPGAVSVPATSLRFVDISTPHFTDVTPINIPLSNRSDLVVGDFDGDLRQDIFIANEWTSTTPEGHRLYLNKASGFVDATTSSGINALMRSSAPSVVTGDFDNDMDLDIFYDGGKGTEASRGDLPNVILWNNGNGTFVADPQAAGATGPGFGSPPDMVTTADYDVDGNLDLLLTYDKNPSSTVQLYRNRGAGNHWVEVDLRGVTSSRDAIGAKVFVTAGGKTQIREKNGGVHFKYGQNDQRLHFGLGTNTSVEEIRVAWPEGPDTVIRNVPADRLMRITQEAPIGEVGRIPFLTHVEQTIVLSRSYTDPLVFVQPISKKGKEFAVPRVTAVGKDRFSVRLQEAENHDGVHLAGEAVSWLVLERGMFVLGDRKLEVDARMQAGATWQQLGLSMPFTAAPVIVSQAQTNNDPEMVVTRQNLVTKDIRKFWLLLQESEAETRSGDPHGAERVGWLAIDGGTSDVGTLPMLATKATVSSTLTTVPFPTAFTVPPALIGGIATQKSADTVTLRYKVLSASDVSLRVEEDTTWDAETYHPAETVNLLAFGLPANETATLRASRVEWPKAGVFASTSTR